MKILHISYDLRDRRHQEKTTAVRNLIDQTSELADTIVVDLLRVPKLKEEQFKIASDNHFMINSFGLPYGLFLKRNLTRVYHKLLKEDEKGSLLLDLIDVVHSHKLTYEGYIGYLLVRKLDVPLFITLRQTDFWVLKYKLNLHPVYREILKRAAKIFYIVPYMVKAIEKIFGEGFFRKYIQSKLVFLPNIVCDPAKKIMTGYDRGALLTVLRMTKESATRKNIKRLFQAIPMMNDDKVYLNVIGDGDYLGVVKGWAKKYHVANKTNFIGAVPNSEIGSYYSRAQAMVMPSLSESFGMVYAESLLCGTPILYSKNTGFDGMFENVGPVVNPRSLTSIAKGLVDIVENNDFYRDSIQKLRQDNKFQIFSPSYIKATYAKTLEQIG